MKQKPNTHDTVRNGSLAPLGEESLCIDKWPMTIMSLPNGTYRTTAGSVVRVHGKKILVDFDWFFEDDACIECQPVEVVDERLIWTCAHCRGGSAKLARVKAKKNKGAAR